MKVAVLCNSLMGVPSLQFLAQMGWLSAIGIPAVEHEATHIIRDLAARLNVPLTVFERESFAETSVAWLKNSGAETILVYTFPYLLGRELLSLPPLGCLNFHFGLLPQYRGADAIFWEIRNREPFGAVTVHKMESGLDTGPILIQQKVPIQATDTYGVHMSNLGGAAMAVTHQLLTLLSGDPARLHWQEQDETQARQWPKPGQQEVLIDWNQMSADEVTALIRACNPWNKGAYTFLGNEVLRITIAMNSPLSGDGLPPGTLIIHPESGTRVACRDNASIVIETVYLGDAGFFSGRELTNLGIVSGMTFSTPQI